jgi:exopolysaccharide production protein ExoF
MRAIVKTSVVALTAALALGSVVYGQSAAPQQRPVEGSAPAPAMSARLPVEIGDKLRISFYETIDMAATKQNGPETQGALRTFYQRMDLSGEYAVEQDGAISIPLLGRFQVEGKSLDEIRADLGVSFTTVIGRSANTDIKISERSPIYVVGPVKNPGAYKYVPGMIVLHAMALAGGLDRGEGNLSGMIDGAREMERLRTMTLQVKQLLARRTRLEAERDGASTLPLPIQLVRLAGEGTARSFIATESTILRAEQVKRQQQDREIALKIATGRNEVEALKRKLEQVDVQKDLRLERLNDMQKLKDRGLVTSSNILTLRTELADLEAHRQDYLVGILQAEARLADAEEASPRQLSEESASLAKEIATVDKDIAAAQEAMISARVLATILYKPNSGGEAYEIVRQSKDGAKMLQATETSPLMPGDVLKITPKAGAVSPSFAAPVAPSTDPALTHIRTANQD